MKRPATHAEDETPVVGRDSGFPRPTHPAFEGTDHLDPLTARLLTLLRMYPDAIKFRADNLAEMDPQTKRELLDQFTEVLGIDSPGCQVIPL